jgi:hypothetical protein
MENKQTAVEWLEEQVIDNKDIYIKGNTLMIPNDIFRKAKQMEKEQIKDAYWSGEIDSDGGGSAEQFYNKTYGK